MQRTDGVDEERGGAVGGLGAAEAGTIKGLQVVQQHAQVVLGWL
jgi:hypothetical protein